MIVALLCIYMTRTPCRRERAVAWHALAGTVAWHARHRAVACCGWRCACVVS